MALHESVLPADFPANAKPLFRIINVLHFPFEIQTDGRVNKIVIHGRKARQVYPMGGNKFIITTLANVTMVNFSIGTNLHVKVTAKIF